MVLHPNVKRSYEYFKFADFDPVKNYERIVYTLLLLLHSVRFAGCLV